ncbi:hypothetical protein, partial [Collinsella aerofaciens]|uniref:hypothetical protein n=1 Tax=Collinsella aerofaciens TaxID=74426 RepID=UPI001E5B0F42
GMTRRSMPCLFHANLFALGGARWRCQSIGVPIVQICKKGMPKRGRFILVGFIWANVVVYRNVVVGDVLV